jgi:hypothetical protein
MREFTIRSSAGPFGNIRRDGNRRPSHLVTQQIALTRWQTARQPIGGDGELLCALSRIELTVVSHAQQAMP